MGAIKRGVVKTSQHGNADGRTGLILNGTRTRCAEGTGRKFPSLARKGTEGS